MWVVRGLWGETHHLRLRTPYVSTLSSMVVMRLTLLFNTEQDVLAFVARHPIAVVLQQFCRGQDGGQRVLNSWLVMDTKRVRRSLSSRC